MTWAEAGFAIGMALASILGVALTAMTLPGIWLPIVLVIVLKLTWSPEIVSWWTIGASIALAVIAEAIEFGASAVGAAKTGGSKGGAIGSVVGSLVGAILGSFFIFPIGTIAGAVIGAGLGAAAGERGMTQKTWRESARVGKGAAIGRAVATVVKTLLAGVVGAILTLAVML